MYFNVFAVLVSDNFEDIFPLYERPTTYLKQILDCRPPLFGIARCQDSERSCEDLSDYEDELLPRGGRTSCPIRSPIREIIFLKVVLHYRSAKSVQPTILFSFFSECYLSRIQRIDENIEDIDIGDECTIAELLDKLDCDSADV